MDARFSRARQPQRPAALGVLFAGPRPPGVLAAPTRPGRRFGGVTVPVLNGLFQAGRVKQISQINISQTNIRRGG